MKELQGKVALVTGGSHDISRAICLGLAGLGAEVVFNHTSADHDADKLLAEIRKSRVRCSAHAVDIADEQAVREMVASIVEEHGHVDILVNNAGSNRDTTFTEMTRAVWDEVLGVNLNGPFNVTHAVLENMISREWGRIVNITSAGDQIGPFGHANQTVTKGGLIAFTMTLAREVARRGITVNAVAPGYVATDRTKTISDTVLEQIHRSIPMDRMGTPAEVAEAVIFLAGPRASYITGQVIGVNGGATM